LKEETELTKQEFQNFMDSYKFGFKTVQKKICFHIIKRIYSRCKRNYYFNDIKACYNKMIIVEGNHRYIAYLLAGIEFSVIESSSNNSDNPLEYSNLAIDFDNDWDVHLYKNRRFIIDGEWLEEFKRK